jgi:hypothetical protein
VDVEVVLEVVVVVVDVVLIMDVVVLFRGHFWFLEFVL